MSKNMKLVNAVIMGQLDEVKEILKQKSINVDETNEDGMTPLMLASFNNHFEIAKELIKAGASLDIKDIAEWSAISYSMFVGNVDIAILLIQSGANYKEIEEKEEFLAFSEVKDFIEMIKEKEFLNSFNVNKFSAFKIN